MFLSAHITVGAAIGSATGNPILAVIFSFISYYLLNCIPHWEPKDNKLLRIGDIILSIIIILLLSILLPTYISNTKANMPDAYPLSLNTIPVFGLGISPLILICGFTSILPYLIKIIGRKIKSDNVVFKYNEKAIKFFKNIDNRFMGKFVQIATIVVFGLYSFRLIPNSDSAIFSQIIFFILIIVSILALLETFTEDTKENVKA